ncbi:MAG: YbgA family protein [Eubacteriales bacterium]
MSIINNEDKPVVVVSRCLGFCKCRYNGDMIKDHFVEALKEHVNFITVCPEVEIGLGVPRNPVRLVLENEKAELYQPADDKTYTKEMEKYAADFFGSANRIHGFILKGRSPSCGIKDVKIYMNKEKSAGSTKGAGLFAAYAMKLYPNLPTEEEGRLTNYAIRENFLTKLYTFFRFQKAKDSGSMKELVKFHSDHKYLLLAYNQSQTRILGKITANHEKKPFKEITDEYELHLGLAFARLPSKNNYINTFMHIFGYFSDELTDREKTFILDRFQKFKEDKLHISVVLNLLRTYVIKYNQEYLLNQVIWAAYPEELLDISDSGK